MNRNVWLIFILFIIGSAIYIIIYYNKRKYIHKVDISSSKKTNFRLYKDVESDSHKILNSYKAFFKKQSTKLLKLNYKKATIMPLLIISSLICSIIRKEIDEKKPKVYRVIQGASHEYLKKIKVNPMTLPFEKQSLIVYKLVKSTIGNEMQSSQIKKIFTRHFKELYSKYVPN